MTTPRVPDGTRVRFRSGGETHEGVIKQSWPDGALRGRGECYAVFDRQNWHIRVLTRDQFTVVVETPYEMGTTLRWRDPGRRRWRRGHVVRVRMPGSPGNPGDEPSYCIFDDRGGRPSTTTRRHSEVEPLRKRGDR